MANFNLDNSIYRTIFKLFSSIFLILFFVIKLQSQEVVISITNPAGVNVCDTSETVLINIQNITSATLESISMDIILPTGIEYEPSSIINLSNYYVQEQDITNLSSIVLTANDLHGDSTISFSIGIKATMEAITYQNNGNVFRNDITVYYDGGMENEISNAFNLYYPVLSIVSVTPSTKSINSGDSFTRQVTIVNAGNGRASSFLLSDIHDEGIELTSVDVGVLNETNDTISISEIDFINIGNNDNYFNTNESIVITQTISASGCQSATITSTIFNLWGCENPMIQGSNTYAHTSVSLKNPNISVSTTNELTSCFGMGSSSDHTITLKNNGQGTADNLQLDLFKSRGNGYQQDIFSRIDESSITYEIDGGGAIPITPSTTYPTDISGSYSCLGSNAIGRVLLDLPDLESGEQLVLTFSTYHCNINICNGDYVKGWKYEIDYTDVCNINSYNKAGTGQNPNNTYMSIFAETPTDINDGETKEFNFTVSSHKNDLPVGNGASYRVVFTLPPGLEYSNLEFYSNNVWNPSSIYYNTNLNTVTADYELPLPAGFNITKAAFNLDLTGNCNMSGAQAGIVPITMDISYFTDESCSFEIPFVCDETVTVDLHCPSGGPCEGMAFAGFSLERTSFGVPDNDQNGLPDVGGILDFDRVKTNRAMYGDTIRGTFTGIVYTSENNPSWEYGYASQTIEWGTYLTEISASVKVFDASSSTYIVCSNVPLTTSTSGLDKSFIYNISADTLAALCSDFIGFTYNNGDSVWIYADYRVTTNIGGDIQQLKSTNEFYLSNVENPGSNGKYQCGYYNDNYTLIGYYFRNDSRNNFRVTSCSKTVSQNFYLSIGDCCSNYNGGNLFPSEYRYWAHIKTATVEIPPYYDVSNVMLRIRRTRKTNQTSTEVVYGLTPSSVNGQLYTFDLEQHYQEYGGTIKFSDDGFKGTLYMDLSPSCDVPLDTYQDLTWRFNFQKGEFLGGDESGFVDASNPDRIKFNPPALTLSSNNPILDGLTKTVSWDLKVGTSSSNTNADNSWIHIKNPSGDIEILHVIDDETGDTISITGDIFRLGTVSGGSEKDLTIIGKYSACYADYMTVYSGYECTDYPETFNDFKCSFTTIGLFVEPKPAQMQATLIGRNIGNECGNTVEVEVDISSVKFASVDSISVLISTIGNSMTFINGSGLLKYPLSSSYMSIGDPASTGGSLIYNIVDHNSTIAQDGLPGVLELTKNHFKLKFNMNLESNFVPGHSVSVSVAGQSVCGQSVPTINLAFDPSVGFQMATSSGLTNDAADNWSSSWGDFNNDGYDDLFVTTYDDSQPNILYMNNGDKTFTKITSGDIVTDKASSVASSWGDYDNDGYLDLFVANNAGSNNFLYHNNGNSTFTKITSGDIVEYGVYCHNAAWADYDNDGYLDLFVAEYFPTKTNHLFHNNGDNTFTRVEGSPVVTDAGHSIGAAWGDYNNDGLVDLFVPNTNNEPNWLYKNIGNGQFEKVNENVISTASNSVGCSWGDYNNDGYLDLFIANSGNANNFLYKNNGDGTFSTITSGSIVNDEANSHGSTWVDIDNDGDLDLYVTNDQEQNNFLYRNEGDESFTRVENDLTNNGGNSFGTSIADYDNDGDFDLFVANHGENPNFFFENIKGQCSEYLCLNLIGSNSNYAAIGTKVRAKANIYGVDTWQMHEVSSQSGGGAGGQNTLKVILGMGDATTVDSLIIEWPSGYKEIHTNVSSTSSDCNVYLEPDGALISGKAYVDANLNCQYDEGEMLMKNIAIDISPEGKRTYTNSEGEYSFYMNTGTFEISVETPEYYSQYCPSNNGINTVVINEVGTSYPNNDFGFQADGSQPDLSVCLSTTMLRINFTNDYAITYENNGNANAINDTIVLTFDEGIEVISSTLPWDLKDGQSVYWYFSSIPPQTSVTFYVTDSVTPNVTFGAYATNTVSINSGSTETNLGNNSCSDVSEYVGAIDPNDKLVYPEENIPPGEAITYKIRFQNVGNFPAESVIIYDTLSNDLDISTLSNIQTSHESVFTIIDEHILMWDFKNINLPDSVHNEPESHGYVQFEITPYADVPNGRIIENSATIIFDYYQHTPTNTTTTEVKPEFTISNAEDKLLIYPQPVVNLMTLHYNAVSEGEVLIQIWNSKGQLVLQDIKVAATGWNVFDYNLFDQSRGMHTISLSSADGVFNRKLLIIR